MRKHTFIHNEFTYRFGELISTLRAGEGKVVMKTYGDLKMRKAELRNEMESGDYSNYEEYRRIVQWIKNEELWLLWRIVCLIVIVSLIQGCNTVDGLRTDVHQWTENPTHHQQSR